MLEKIWTQLRQGVIDMQTILCQLYLIILPSFC